MLSTIFLLPLLYLSWSLFPAHMLCRHMRCFIKCVRLSCAFYGEQVFLRKSLKMFHFSFQFVGNILPLRISHVPSPISLSFSAAWFVRFVRGPGLSPGCWPRLGGLACSSGRCLGPGHRACQKLSVLSSLPRPLMDARRAHPRGCTSKWILSCV